MKISTKNILFLICLGSSSILLAPRDTQDVVVPTIETAMLSHVVSGNYIKASQLIKDLRSLDIRNERGRTLLEISRVRDLEMGLREDGPITTLLRSYGAKIAAGYDYPRLYCDETL